MTGRTQCEGEVLYRSATDKISYVSATLQGAAISLGKNGFKGPAIVLEGLSIAAGAWAFEGGKKADRLEEGCKKEIAEQAKKDAAAAAAGAAGGGGGDPHGVVTDGGVKHCGQMYVGGSSSSFSSGGVYYGSTSAGSWIGVCMPIALDLDGDGIEYRTMSSPIYTDSDGDGERKSVPGSAPMIRAVKVHDRLVIRTPG